MRFTYFKTIYIFDKKPVSDLLHGSAQYSKNDSLCEEI